MSEKTARRINKRVRRKTSKDGEMTYTRFGQIMIKRGFSNKEIANRFNISTTAVINYMHGYSIPRLDIALKICDSLQLPYSSLKQLFMVVE